MNQKFEEILSGLGFTFDERDILEGYIHKKSDLQELMESVWNLAIETAAANADADYNIIDNTEVDDLLSADNIEVYVLNNSILRLKINNNE